MNRSTVFYLVGVFSLSAGIFGVYWLAGSFAGSLDHAAATGAGAPPPRGHLWRQSTPSAVERPSMVETIAGELEAAKGEEAQTGVVEKYPNENAVRSIIQNLKDGIIKGDLSDVAYQSYLADLETLIGASSGRFADVWMTIQSEFGDEYIASLEDPAKVAAIKADVERKFGFAWGQADPEQSLNFARQAGDPVLAGWLAGQIHAENNYIAMLGEARVKPSAEVYWTALVDIAQSDTILSLDTIMANHMDEMDLVKWKEVLFAPGNSDDAVLASWFQDNIDELSRHDNFDEVEVVRMLRRFDYGEGSFLQMTDLARVEAAKAAGDYVGTARILEELSLSYGDTIDASAAGRFTVEWAREDFVAASNWLLENADKFNNSESFLSMLGTSYRHEARRNPERALEQSLQIENEEYRATTVSNVLIPQIEKSGTAVPSEWVSNLPQGVVKKRTMAGYVLGLSRHSEETTLEAQVKFQFLQEDFDLPLIQQQVLDSQLTSDEKISVINLISTY